MDQWIVGVVSGLISGSLTCWFFYWLSGRDLKREANHLKRESGDLKELNILIIRAMQNAGIADVVFDENGIPRGLRYIFVGDAGAGDTITLGGSAVVQVARQGNAEESDG